MSDITWNDIPRPMWQAMGLCRESYRRWSLKPTPRAAWEAVTDSGDIARAIGGVLPHRDLVQLFFDISVQVFSPYLERFPLTKKVFDLVQLWLDGDESAQKRMYWLIQEALDIYYGQFDRIDIATARIGVAFCYLVQGEDRNVDSADIIFQVCKVLYSDNLGNVEVRACKLLRDQVPWERMVAAFQARREEFEKKSDRIYLEDDEDDDGDNK